MPAPTYAEADRYSNRVDNFGKSLKQPYNGGPLERKYDGGVAGGYDQTPEFRAQHPRYPDYVYPDDKERDTEKMIKTQLAQSGYLGKVFADRSDVQYILDKKNAQELALFKTFVEDSIPRGTPWAREFFEKLMPGWYQSKIEIVDDKLSIIKRFIDMTYVGPQSIEDMFLLYQLYAGKIEIPQNWAELLHGREQYEEKYFASGLFCPKTWINNHLRISKRNQDFMANFAIPGIDTKGALVNTTGLGNPYLFAASPADESNVGVGIITAQSEQVPPTALAGPAFFGNQILAENNLTPDGLIASRGFPNGKMNRQI